MPFTYTWNASFESLPDDNNYVYQVDDYIRYLCVAVRERMEIDHIWKVGATDGQHKKITLNQISAPTLAADTMFIYCKDVSGKIQLFVMDEDGNERQITSATSGSGVASEFEAGTKIPFYQDAAPTGWTAVTNLAESLLGCKKTGSGAGTTYATGGAEAGTWTIDGITVGDHTAHVHDITDHKHNKPTSGSTNGGFVLSGGNYVTTGGIAAATNTGSGGPTTHTVTLGDTWRPLVKVCTICGKD